MNRLEISKQVRKKILSYIKRKPGIHFCEILRCLELPTGNLAYHILKLEETKKIFSVYDGYWKRFYSISMKDKRIPNLMSPKQEKIYNFIIKNPGSTYKDILKMYGTSRQTIVYHIRKLRKVNLIRGEREKRTYHFYVNEKIQ